MLLPQGNSVQLLVVLQLTRSARVIRIVAKSHGRIVVEVIDAPWAENFPAYPVV